MKQRTSLAALVSPILAGAALTTLLTSNWIDSRSQAICTAPTLMHASMLMSADLNVADRIEHWIDIRQASDGEVDAPAYVAFAARWDGDEKTWTGHAFLVLHGPSGTRKQTISTAIGFHPADGKDVGLLEQVKGELADEIYDRNSVDYATHILRVQVTHAQLDRVLRFLADRELDVKNGTYQYRIAKHDCVTLLQDIVSELNKEPGAVDLKQPDRKALDNFPQLWLERLILLNVQTGVPHVTEGDSMLPSVKR